MELENIKSDHTKKPDSLDMRISASKNSNPSSYYGQAYTYIMNWSLIKSSDKSSHESQLIKKFPSFNLEGDTVTKIKNDGMPIDPHFANPYQQTKTGQHTNKSIRQTMIYQKQFSLHALI